MKAPTGHYFRRAAGKYFNADDPAAKNAVIYYAWEHRTSSGKRQRTTLCLFTRDMNVARHRVDYFGGEPIPLDDFDHYLWEIVLLGRRAEQEMTKRLSKKK